MSEHVIAKRCHKCDGLVRMSGPEFARDPQTWTTCQRCRDIINAEFRYIGQAAEQPKETTHERPQTP